MNSLAFEDIIRKIAGVNNVKIISEEDNIQEIHILANKLRAPKQIVRDIESSLLAVFGYRVDRKVISIAQIETGERKPIKRIQLDGISMSTSGSVVECEVRILHDGEEFSITQRAIKTTANRRKVVAEGTIKAVEKVMGQTILFDIQDVIISENRDITFVNVLVNLVVGRSEECLIGAAIVEDDINEAISKATLDAINRRIQKNKF